MKIVKDTFQKLNDLVVPTMGAKGRMAIIEQDMDRPLITDDGVTVARESRQLFQGIEKIPATSAIEAAATTEVEARDGTTLTILLINELYKLGLSWTKPMWKKGGLGLHPQVAADTIANSVYRVRAELFSKVRDADAKNVYAVAKTSTKMEIIGRLVQEAYEKAGYEMNVLIEHDRTQGEHHVEHQEGMILESGYFAEVMRSLCNKGDKTEYKKAKVALLSSDAMTYNDISDFFSSIPEGERGTPLVFVVTRKFNPESLHLLVNTLNENKFTFQMVFINEDYSEELFLDLAAYTNGKIQDVILSTDVYLYEHCGTVDRIIIEQNKTTIFNKKGNVKQRVEVYRKEVKDNKYFASPRREVMLKRRISALTNGITTIKIAVNTITEFNILKLKLDDAIGAVKNSLLKGVLPGGGVALYNLTIEPSSKEIHLLRSVLRKPMEQILKNAGLRFSRKLKRHWDYETGIDVITGEVANMWDNDIVDSFSSIDSALKNASSIASSYLRGYTTIQKFQK